ncbi:hypothetical protein [Haloarcula salina]|uniref:DUF7974 domain-containing protein n=1 Tax=Haloarcula salina TaxID=1429914 RepID=A0AA41KGY8_9EURY|nr:hypothetical protein [Haloarcula salina]MBV0903612.1 hypothetical protein [Haloarcula salina]
MRRSYGSGDDPDARPPSEGGHGGDSPEAARSLDAAAWSDRLLPRWLRYRAVSVAIEVPNEASTRAEIHFVVTMKNALPVPVTIPTDSLRPWTWYVDGLPEASHVDSVPNEASAIRFDRGERKRFRRRWDGLFRVSEDEWERAPAGEYAIGAGLSVPDAAERGLYSEATVSLAER